MLTKMPKVGDVLIAKDTEDVHFMGDITPGEEYAVNRLDSDGDAVIEDDVGDERSIYGVRKRSFEFKEDEVPPNKIGYIEFVEEQHSSDGSSLVILRVDTAGFQSVCSLRDASIKERSNAMLREKIAQCEAELNHLNELLAEVDE